jgi:glycerate-2-kinase
LPCEGLELADMQELTKILLTCGANIVEINAVRKHASQVGGGRLAMALDPGVRIVNITASDVIGDALDYVTDPSVPDTSFVEDARATLTRFHLWNRVPPRVAAFFGEAGNVKETPKELPHEIQNEMLLSSSSAPDAARVAASQLGYETLVLSSCFEGESSALGQTFASIAHEIVLRDRPLRRPCAVIGGGETVVKMNGFGGRGGPNQEFALAGAMHLPSAEVVLLGVDTDGTDGPTELAGGLCDALIREHAAAREVEVGLCLAEHRASDALQALSDAVITGSTGSNVNDLKLMLIR